MSSLKMHRTTTPPMHGEIKLLIDDLKVLGTDPSAYGLKIIEVPLSETPNSTWIQCLKDPGISIRDFHGAQVVGKAVRIRADKQNPDGELDSLIDVVRATNERYQQAVQEIQNQEQRRGEMAKREEEENRGLEERLRKRE